MSISSVEFMHRGPPSGLPHPHVGDAYLQCAVSLRNVDVDPRRARSAHYRAMRSRNILCLATFVCVFTTSFSVRAHKEQMLDCLQHTHTCARKIGQELHVLKHSAEGLQHDTSEIEDTARDNQKTNRQSHSSSVCNASRTGSGIRAPQQSVRADNNRLQKSYADSGVNAPTQKTQRRIKKNATKTHNDNETRRNMKPFETILCLSQE